MAEKHIVVQGAICKCQYGQAPDTLKVLSHDKEYANDKDASKKRIATTKEIGEATLEKNTFGNCLKIGGNPPPPCKPVITEWKDFYDKVTLSNGGNILLEDSKAVCVISGTPCIEIIDHGQRTEASAQNFKNTNKEIQRQINPLVDIDRLFDGATVSEIGKNLTALIVGEPDIFPKKEEIKAKCVVHFRPHDKWQGEFGFDWVRTGDTGRVGDKKWYRKIVGKNRDSRGNISNVNYGNNIVPDVNEYTKLLREYKVFKINFLNDFYVVPWVSLYIRRNSYIEFKTKHRRTSQSIEI